MSRYYNTMVVTLNAQHLLRTLPIGRPKTRNRSRTSYSRNVFLLAGQGRAYCLEKSVPSVTCLGQSAFKSILTKGIIFWLASTPYRPHGHRSFPCRHNGRHVFPGLVPASMAQLWELDSATPFGNVSRTETTRIRSLVLLMRSSLFLKHRVVPRSLNGVCSLSLPFLSFFFTVRQN